MSHINFAKVKGYGDCAEPEHEPGALEYSETLDIEAMADEFVITGGKYKIPGLDWMDCATEAGDCKAIEILALAALPGGDKIEAAARFLEEMRVYVVEQLQTEHVINAIYEAEMKSMEPDYD